MTDRRCRGRYNFFGLTTEYKLFVHKQIFELGYYSQGAFNQNIGYNLPVFLRNFYYKLLADTKQKESDAMDKSTSKESPKTIKR